MYRINNGGIEAGAFIIRSAFNYRPIISNHLEQNLEIDTDIIEVLYFKILDFDSSSEDVGD